MQAVLGWADYLVIAIVLMISAGIGVYYRFTGGRQKTAEEYFSADRSMKIVPLAIALMVSFISAIALLGISAENYTHGTQFTVHLLGSLFGTPVVAYFYLPVFFELNTMSVFEYLERRFGRLTRLVASAANFMHLILYTGVVLYAPSLALEATTGLSSSTSILLIGTICMFYSTIGGIKAVLITDVFQGLLMYAAIFCVLIVGASELEGGLSHVWEIAKEDGRIEFFDFRFDMTVRHTTWALILGSTCTFLSLYGINQVQVQRLLTVKTLNSARLALSLNIPLSMFLVGLTSFTGLVLYAVYRNCDPVASGKIQSFDRIMPYFVAEKMTRFPGMSGLFIAGVFSASLSTISAMLNSLAAVALEDYMKPIYAKLGKEFPNHRATFFGKCLAIANGTICLVVAFLAGSMGSLITMTISIMGALCGPLLGIFSLGIFCECANEIGTVIGALIAISFDAWMAFGSPKPKPPTLPVYIEGCDNSTVFSNENRHGIVYGDVDQSGFFLIYRISYMWYSIVGTTITMVLGIVISLIVRKIGRTPVRKVEPNLFTPFLANRIRRRMAAEEKVSNSQVFVLDVKDSILKQ